MRRISICLLALLTSGIALAKRLPPPEVKPISKNGTEYSAWVEHTQCGGPSPTCGMQVFLVSKEKSSGNENWRTELYQKLYDPNEETDVQTIYPISMKFAKKNRVQVIDERESKYSVDAKTGQLIQPLKPIIYPSMTHR